MGCEGWGWGGYCVFLVSGVVSFCFSSSWGGTYSWYCGGGPAGIIAMGSFDGKDLVAVSVSVAVVVVGVSCVADVVTTSGAGSEAIAGVIAGAVAAAGVVLGTSVVAGLIGDSLVGSIVGKQLRSTGEDPRAS